MGEVMANCGGEQLSALDQLVDQLIIQTVCENNADFMPSASSQDSESEYTYEEVEVTDSGSEADIEETRQSEGLI